MYYLNTKEENLRTKLHFVENETEIMLQVLKIQSISLLPKCIKLSTGLLRVAYCAYYRLSRQTNKYAHYSQ
jgi:hypothetical protein